MQAECGQPLDPKCGRAACTAFMHAGYICSSQRVSPALACQGGPGARRRFQDVAVLLLLGILGVAVGNLAIKLLIVTWALAAAAFRYTILGVLLIVLLSVFT